MAQYHINHMIQQLSIGWLSIGWPSDLPAPTLDDFEINQQAVAAITDDWVFDTEESYCPLSDIPDELAAPRLVQKVNGRLYVTGNNGMCLFIFRLSQPDAFRG